MKQLSMYDNQFINNFDHAQQTTSTINIVDVYPEKSVPAKQHALTANVTEIVLTKDKIDSIQLILPMLINLHQEKRWLAWIDPPIQLLKEWQKTHHDSALNDVMILRSNDNLSVFELSKRALTAGTCHAVIAWTNNLSQNEFSKLETASSKGNSHGIILKSRTQTA